MHRRVCQRLWQKADNAVGYWLWSMGVPRFPKIPEYGCPKIPSKILPRFLPQDSSKIPVSALLLCQTVVPGAHQLAQVTRRAAVGGDAHAAFAHVVADAYRFAGLRHGRSPALPAGPEKPARPACPQSSRSIISRRTLRTCSRRMRRAAMASRIWPAVSPTST